MNGPLCEDTWLAPEGLSLAAIEGALARRFRVRALPRYRATVTYVDSFDWRLYRSGMMLHTHNRQWTLYGRDGRLTLLRGGPVCRKRCMADAFPEGPMREQLAPVLGNRALLPLARVDLRGRQLQLLERRDESPDWAASIRLVLEEQRLAEQEQRFCLVRVFPLQGREDLSARLRAFLRDMAIVRPVSPLVGFEAGCRAMGRRPLDHSPAFAPVLAGEGHDIGRMDGVEAVRRLGLQLLAVASRNLPGVIDDLDTEFLHHFRMALRRIRVLLGRGGTFLPGERFASFKAGCAELRRATAPLRALDLLLAAEADCLTRVRPELRPALQNRFAEIAGKRDGMRRRLAARLGGAGTVALLADWERMLQDVSPGRRNENLAEYAGRALRRQTGRLSAEAGRSVCRPARLRLLCRQLRYNLEFFGALHPGERPGEPLGPLLDALDAAQVVLNRLRDTAARLRILGETATRADDRNRTEPTANAAPAALAELVQSLRREEGPLRERLDETRAALVPHLAAFAAFLDRTE